MTRIENEAQYEWAVARVEELLPLVNDNTSPDDPNVIELMLLSNLVIDYDEEHYPISPPSLSDTIKLRMYEMKLSQKDIAEMLGISTSRVSEYISGKSEPTLKIAREISKKLDISPSIVLGVC